MSSLSAIGKKAVRRTLGSFGLALVKSTPLPADALELHFDPWLHSRESQLPDQAEELLRPDNPRIQELRKLYASLDWPVCSHSRWESLNVQRGLNLRYFRGESLIVWHYRQGGFEARLRYFLYLQYLIQRGGEDLLRTLGEDGAFGCWTYRFPGYPVCSRDLLDSVNELLFLDQQLGILSSDGLRVLDVGAGYGRMAHRSVGAVRGLADYCCVDAVPESTFLSEYYLGFRKVNPPARAVPLSEVPSLRPGDFDLALNIHSLSECTAAAIDWWVGQLERLRVPKLFLVPNEASGFLSTEVDGTRKDFLPILQSHGYGLKAEEAVFADEAVRQLCSVSDRFCLFELRPASPVVLHHKVASPGNIDKSAADRLVVSLAFDRGYLPYAATTIFSCAQQHRTTGVDFELLHDSSVRPSDIARLRDMLSVFPSATVRFHDVPPREVADLPTTAWFGSIVWLRFLLPYLAGDRERLLYLDSDTIVLSPLHELWSTPLGETPIGAVANVIEPSLRSHIESLGVRYPGGYFNSGVLLMDFDLMRREAFSEQLRDFARRYRERILWPDQDVLNVVFADRWTPLDPRWNAQNSLWYWQEWSAEVFGTAAVEGAKAAPAIRHFEGPSLCKPWHYLCPFGEKDLYLEALAATPWRDTPVTDRTLATQLIHSLPEPWHVPLYHRLVAARSRLHRPKPPS